MTSTTHQIVQSYRALYRHGLHAVQYATPARYTLRSELRYAYRNSSASDFHATKIENTIIFLVDAAKQKGLAHRILKNLLYIWWWQQKTAKQSRLNPRYRKKHTVEQKPAFQPFNITLRKLNESMCMCLPERDSREEEVDSQEYSIATSKQWQGRQSPAYSEISDINEP